MKVLMFSWEYPPHVVGGLGKHVDELIPPLSTLPDVVVHLVTPGLHGGEPVRDLRRAAAHTRAPQEPLVVEVHGDAATHQLLPHPEPLQKLEVVAVVGLKGRACLLARRADVDVADRAHAGAVAAAGCTAVTGLFAGPSSASSPRPNPRFLAAMLELCL